jgi:hypothetical protein
MNKNSLLKKLLPVIYGVSVINILIDLQTDKTRQKNLPVLFCGISIGKFNISPTKKPYVMSSMFLFINQYIHQ